MDGHKLPYGRIQFKETDLCIDICCECGETYHLDGDFIYYVQCGACQRVYELDPFIALIPSDEEKAGEGLWVLSK